MEQTQERIEFIRIKDRRIAAVLHPSSTRHLVIFCHGFRGSKIGPSRFFVRLARQLQAAGVGSLRFDQYGSGDSEGDFLDSSFNDWVDSTTTLAERFLRDGYRVAPLGQSMGGTTVLVTAANLGRRLASVVAWVPGAEVDAVVPDGDVMEEGGERVGWRFWEEAHAAEPVRRFREIPIPTLVFLATEDEYVDAANRQALLAARQPHQRIEVLEGWPHSRWTYDQSGAVIGQTHDFLVSHFR